ncbi:MAG TPA: 3-deoxy-7-phosphoheptulonate synthase, partial [Roseimicrobium sp.]|nr:3-deoxy-7-phosphoheptulonate synthase [Roseimicrobium sp.]
MESTQNLHVVETRRLSSPSSIKTALPISAASARTVIEGREVVKRILAGEDKRLLVVIGPCSIHDPKSAREYARKLNELRLQVQDEMFIIMRVYFEKPRTTIGWKGLVNDPHLDGSYDIESGLKIGRELLLEINDMGLPAATEFLDPIVPQYIADLISWAAIGARTTESQTHREMASGLSMPVGFKNATDGSLQIAIDAMSAAQHAHNFLGIDQDGVTSVVITTGNPDGHVVLRGGRKQTNYDPQSIADAEVSLKKANLPPVMMVDCSHANSGKQHAKQEEVLRSVIDQRVAGNKALIGVMIESHLFEGSQPFPKPANELKYGISITDACIGWETTDRILRHAHQNLTGKGAVPVLA